MIRYTMTVPHPCVRDAVVHFRDDLAVPGVTLRTDRSPWAGEAPPWWPCWAARRPAGVIPATGDRWHSVLGAGGFR